MHAWSQIVRDDVHGIRRHVGRFLRALLPSQQEDPPAWLIDWSKLTNWRDFDSYSVRSLKEEESSWLLEADATIQYDSFLEDVVRPCLKASTFDIALSAFHTIAKQKAHHLDHETEPPTPTWVSDEQDSQLVMAIGHMSLDIFERTTSGATQSEDFQREDEQKRILRILNNVIDNMPESQPSVYCRVLGLLKSAEASKEVRENIAVMIWKYDHAFEIYIQDLQPLLSCVPLCKDLISTRFMQIC